MALARGEKGPFPPQTREGIVSDRRGFILLRRSSGFRTHERIHAARRKGDDRGTRIPFRDQGGHLLVEPLQFLGRIRGSEFLSGEVKDRSSVGKPSVDGSVAEVSRERLDARRLEGFARRRVAEARDRDHPPPRAEHVETTAQHPREMKSHLSPARPRGDRHRSDRASRRRPGPARSRAGRVPRRTGDRVARDS